MGQDEVLFILDELTKTITSAKTESGKRNISTNALKTALGDIQPNMASKGVQKCSPLLLPGIAQEELQDMKADCMDILADILRRFGDMVSASHEPMQQALVPCVTHKLASIRKRAVTCIGKLLPAVEEGLG